jgi:hypothetical protein
MVVGAAGSEAIDADDAGRVLIGQHGTFSNVGSFVAVRQRAPRPVGLYDQPSRDPESGTTAPEFNGWSDQPEPRAPRHGKRFYSSLSGPGWKRFTADAHCRRLSTTTPALVRRSTKATRP